MLFKHLALLAIASTFSMYTCAQNWQLLVSDPQGDVGTPSVQDAKTLSYAVDSIADSLWFKVELYDTVALNRDWGFFLGLDTDQDTTNGAPWNGYQNNSLRIDYAVEFYNNMFFPPTVNNLLTHDQQLVTDSVYYRIEPEHTLVIRLPLSLIDSDTHMNVIASWADFTGSRWDDLPNTGYVTTGATTTATSHPTQVGPTLRIMPNPASDWLAVEHAPGLITTLLLADMHGRTVLTAPASGAGHQLLDVSGLAPGMYFLKAATEHHATMRRIIVR